jgi:hypothetical protein
LLAFELLRIEPKAIMGYKGRGPIRVAFEQGETNLDRQTTNSYLVHVKPLVEEGKAIPLFAQGVVDKSGNLIRDPVFPEMPTIKEVYKMLHGTEPSGIVWKCYKAAVTAGYTTQQLLWVHADAPAEAVQALRKAGAKMITDPKFLEGAKKIVGGYQFYAGEDLEAAIKALTQMPKDVQEWIHRYLREKHGITRLQR